MILRKFYGAAIVVVGCLSGVATLYADNYINKIYCSLLGKEDASCKYKDIVKEALHTFGVKEFEQVPVKRIGATPLRFMGDEYVSFTMQGIWLNETVLENYPESEVVFILYREAAHYAYRDHAKQLLTLLPAAWLFYTIPHLTLGFLKLQYALLRLGALIIISGFTIEALDSFLMGPVARYLEKHAELAATRVLCKVNKYKVVQSHIEYLQSLIAKGESQVGIWTYPLSERVSYITSCYKEFENDMLINVQ